MGEQKKITGVLVRKDKASIVSVADELEEYYKLLGCSLIEIVDRRIAPDHTKKLFSIVCDEEGLCKNEPRISAISSFGEIDLVGDLFITGASKNGHLTSLEADDADEILKACRMIPTERHPEGIMILTKCDQLM